MSSNGPIQGQGPQGTSPFSQYNADALDKADKSEVIRIKGDKIKVGTSEGSFFNRKVRKRLGNFSGKMRASYQAHAEKATRQQRDTAFAKMREATADRYNSTSIDDRQVTVADIRRLISPPNIPDDVLKAIKNHSPSANELNSEVYEALQDASKDLHKEEKLEGKDLVGGARFGNIYVPKKTAINVEVAQEDGSYQSKPMHANRVGGRFIATQAPLSDNPRLRNDNGQSTSVFFQMLHQENTETVVNLTSTKDAEDKKSNCQYWPKKVGETEIHGNLMVKTTGMEKKGGFDVITIKIGPEGDYSNSLNDEQSKEVKIFHFHAWPDHGVPKGKNVEKFHNFQAEVKARGEAHNTTVHCRAGVGRTGVFITLDQLKKDAKNGLVNRSNLLTKAAETVWEGRKERGKHFVQQSVQFDFIISEMEKELDRLDEQQPDSTNSTAASRDDEGSVTTATTATPEKPPHNEAPTAKSFMDNWYAGAYSEEQMFEAIRAMDSQEELNGLHKEISSFENTDEEDLAFYGLLLSEIEKREHSLPQDR